MALKLVNVEANTLPDAWFQLIYAALESGRRFQIDQGSYAGQTRLEFDWVTCRIAQPHLRDPEGWPLIPEMPDGCGVPAPVTKDFLADYAAYLMTGGKEPGEQYTYGQRLWAADHPGDSPPINQVDTIIDRYKNGGHRNNQLVLQIAQPDDLLLPDPPCLRHIDTRVQDGKLHFFIYFRSWDAWGGFPANLAGISMLHEYMAAEIGVEQGEFVCTSKGLHLYGYVEELAQMRCGKGGA